MDAQVRDSTERLIEEYIEREFLHDRPRNLLDGNLVESGIVDSLGIMTLIEYVESQLGARIRPEDVVVENFESISAIARLVRERAAG
jgi:acyl carrier protein